MSLLKKKLKKKFNEMSRSNWIFESLYRAVIREKRRKSFQKLAGLPTDDKLVVFESFMGRKYADSPKAIYEYLRTSDEFKDYRFVWCLRKAAREDHSYLANDSRTRIVPWGSRSYYEAYARGKYWFANARIPESITRKEDQVYVQCWHGTPLKKLGCDIKSPSKREDRVTRHVFHKDAERYSYMISPSRYYSEHITTAFDLKELGKENVILETGYPRNDAIVNHSSEDCETIKTRLGIPDGKRIILYAPTYREDKRDDKNRYRYNEPLDFSRLFKSIDDDYLILFRAHYYIADAFDFAAFDGRIIDVSKYPEINDLYIISDLLITDYSSVLYDYGILKRPMVFYVHDLDHYKDELRGMYMDLRELPGSVAATQDDVEELIRTMDSWTKTEDYEKKYDEFYNRFVYLEDGKATKRVVDIVINHSGK